MKYLRWVCDDVDPAPFLAEHAALNDAWAQPIGRQDKIAIQREALASGNASI